MLTKADELRKTLDQLEADLGKLGLGMGVQALELLHLMDRSTQLLSVMQQEGRNLIEEELRLESASRQLQAKASLWLHEMGGISAAAEARRVRRPSPEQWWWFLDRQVEQERKRSLRRTLLWAGGITLVAIVLMILYNLFLAPDPDTRARMSYVYDAEGFAQQGEYALALAEVEKALELAPQDPELLILKGVLQKASGQDILAEQTFKDAQLVIDDPENFYLERGRRYYFVQLNEEALADAQSALQVNPQSPMGYLLLGQALEALGDSLEALDAYERASELATSQNQPEVIVFARTLYGNLLQRIGIPTQGSPEGS